MKESSDVVREAADILAGLEKKRGTVLDSSRLIVRKTKSMIHAIHMGEDCTQISDSLEDDVGALLSAIGDEPSILCSGIVQDTLSEYAEAMIFASVIRGVRIPSFNDLSISPQSWVVGLADSIGEMRRMILTYLADGKLSDARSLFEVMDAIGDDVLGFDVPDAIVPIRRKQDVARGVIEKTRSDLTNAIVLAQYKN